NLNPYIKRKLFIVNTGHASIVYIGSYLGYKTIADTLKNSRIKKFISNILKESGEALIQKQHFNRDHQQKYIETTIQRFMNLYISDEVERVARNTIRLGAND